MRLDISEIVLIVVILILTAMIYDQSNDIEDLYETLEMQSEAINRQQSLIKLQMDRIEYYEYQLTNPVHQNEGRLL